jgi:hypothetical protein
MPCLLVGQHCDAHVASLASVFVPGATFSGSRAASTPLERQHVDDRKLRETARHCPVRNRVSRAIVA